ncbi:hypothetical protein [Streptomyces subrutilus]|nr:hypothetical protein [Streptomyces subrutilus]
MTASAVCADTVRSVRRQPGENGAAGTLLPGFYKNHIIDGLEDGFLVQIS